MAYTDLWRKRLVEQGHAVTDKVFSVVDNFDMAVAATELDWHLQGNLTNIIANLRSIGIPYYMNLSPETYRMLLDRKYDTLT